MTTGRRILLGGAVALLAGLLVAAGCAGEEDESDRCSALGDLRTAALEEGDVDATQEAYDNLRSIVEADGTTGDFQQTLLENLDDFNAELQRAEDNPETAETIVEAAFLDFKDDYPGSPGCM